MSVMDDCIIAREFSGVRVTHDATECGVLEGLYEMAMAGNHGLRIEKKLIPVLDVVRKTAKLFDFDPFCSISEGTLLSIVSKKDAEPLVSEFKRNKILSAIVGEVVDAKKNVKIFDDNKVKSLTHPKTALTGCLSINFQKKCNLNFFCSFGCFCCKI